MDLSTPQAKAAPGAPVTPSRRKFFDRKNKSKFLTTKFKPRALGYRSSPKDIPHGSNPQINEATESTLIESVNSSSLQPPLHISPETIDRSTSNDNASKDTKKNIAIPKESRLKRPSESLFSTEPVERPLERPSDDEEEIVFADIVATFAVDVSGSTEGKVLEEEKDAITTLSVGLSRDARTQAEIIPWTHYVQPIVRLPELWTLRSSGGTNPSRLNTDSGAQTALSKCSAWFLLTDGEIDQNEIRDFSEGICGAGLHGAPCVIILFGYKTSRPIKCNISVGLSVFSNAADCLFLFHDIDTSQVYILQSKGRFNSILPPYCHELILNEKTLWTDLPRFGYSQLFDLPLPKRQKLRAGDLLLQGGEMVNLEDLYHHKVESSAAREIMENDDNLKSVLLAAQLRGDDNRIRHWISEQMLQGSNLLQSERPDVNHRAAQSMETLFAALVRQDLDTTITSLRDALRKAHYANWSEFLSILLIEQNRMSARETVVTDAMTRIDTNRKEMTRGTNSPSLLSPVSPGLRPPGMPPLGGNEILENLPVAPRPSHSALSFRQTSMAHRQSVHNTPHQSRNLPNIANMKSRLDWDHRGILYIKDYKYQWESSNNGIEGTCPICREEKVLLTILLKTPPKGFSTQGFPGRNKRKGLTYPLAMGSFPETDILSPHVCCDSCAYTMIRWKIHPDDDPITAAIPLMPAAFRGEFQHTTLSLIDAALQQRFHESVIILVFLSIIHNTLSNLDGDNIEMQSEAFTKTSSWMVASAKLPHSLSISITGSVTHTSSLSGDPLPLLQVLLRNVHEVRDPHSPLLQYPIAGFIVLISIATNMSGNLSKEILQLAVWHRFLFHLVEKHCVSIVGDQVQAVSALQSLLNDSATGLTTDSEPPAGRPSDSSPESLAATLPHAQHGICPSSLCKTHLLSEDDLEEFQRLDDLFEPVEKFSSFALGIFLRALGEEMPSKLLAMDIFDSMRARDDLNDILSVPREL